MSTVLRPPQFSPKDGLRGSKSDCNVAAAAGALCTADDLEAILALNQSEIHALRFVSRWLLSGWLRGLANKSFHFASQEPRQRQLLILRNPNDEIVIASRRLKMNRLPSFFHTSSAQPETLTGWGVGFRLGWLAAKQPEPNSLRCQGKNDSLERIPAAAVHVGSRWPLLAVVIEQYRKRKGRTVADPPSFAKRSLRSPLRRGRLLRLRELLLEPTCAFPPHLSIM